MKIDFINKSIVWWQHLVHSNAVSKGWWPSPPTLDNPVAIAAKLALIHSEVSEALEELRNGKIDVYFNDTKPEGLMIELADVVIRCFDLASALENQGLTDYNLTFAMGLKAEYNLTRPHRHGGKRL